MNFKNEIKYKQINKNNEFFLSKSIPYTNQIFENFQKEDYNSSLFLYFFEENNFEKNFLKKIRKKKKISEGNYFQLSIIYLVFSLTEKKIENKIENLEKSKDFFEKSKNNRIDLLAIILTYSIIFYFLMNNKEKSKNIIGLYFKTIFLNYSKLNLHFLYSLKKIEEEIKNDDGILYLSVFFPCFEQIQMDNKFKSIKELINQKKYEESFKIFEEFKFHNILFNPYLSGYQQLIKDQLILQPINNYSKSNEVDQILKIFNYICNIKLNEEENDIYEILYIEKNKKLKPKNLIEKIMRLDAPVKQLKLFTKIFFEININAKNYFQLSKCFLNVFYFKNINLFEILENDKIISNILECFLYSTECIINNLKEKNFLFNKLIIVFYSLQKIEEIIENLKNNKNFNDILSKIYVFCHESYDYLFKEFNYSEFNEKKESLKNSLKNLEFEENNYEKVKEVEEQVEIIEKKDNQQLEQKKI